MSFLRLFQRIGWVRAWSDRAQARRQRALSTSATALEAARLLRSPTALMQLSEAEALTIVSHMQPCRFASGTVIIRQGEVQDTGFMALVLEGEITVESQAMHRISADTLTVLGPGSLIGEMALVDGEARSATCTATTDVKCALLTRDALEALTEQQPATAAKLMTLVAQRLAQRLRESGHKLQMYSKLLQSAQETLDVALPTPRQRR